MNFKDMSNEQLAELIKKNGKSELKTLLWERVRVLLHMKAGALYSSNVRRCKRFGVDLSDLRQSCYLVFLQALDGYDSTKGFKFTAYLKYPFKNMAAEMLGYRTQNTDTLNSCVSLDEPFGGEDEDLTLMDMLKDDDAVDVLEVLDKQSDCDTVRQEVAKLSPKQREVIEKHYFENVPFMNLADKYGCTYNNVVRIKNMGFRELRKSTQLRLLNGSINREHHLSGFISPENYYLKYIYV